MDKTIIRLGQYLKLMGLVATGGEAKYVIQEGMVQVNDEVEKRRKRQLVAGDKVTLGGQTVTVDEGSLAPWSDPDRIGV